MITNILRYFLLKKANATDISNIFKNEGFIHVSQDIENILKGNQKGVRYGNVVLTRNENGQVEVANALDKDDKFSLPTIEAVKYSLNSRVPYAIFETRENGENFGFMHDSPSFYEKFSEKDMQN